MARKKVVIPRQPSGSYYVNGQINGKSVSFHVDTGASIVAISGDTARHLGIEVDSENTRVGQTAGGKIHYFTVNLDKVSVGYGENTIIRTNVIGGVLPEMEGVHVLLGMSFLGDEIDFMQDDDTLIIYDDSSTDIAENSRLEKPLDRPTTSRMDSIKVRIQIQANIQEIGNANFPDDPNSIWNIESIEQQDSGIFLVDTRPVPNVGYQRIRFHLLSPDKDGVIRADYWEFGRWNPLFYS
ncbi:MAG: hypothetical protein CMB31_06860 [Euryarchaeota archaeon]|nr:hypothetical protein [Euryarchaeota archaeon]